MTTKTQLQNKIQELEAELQEFKQQLGSYKDTPTLQEARVGDTLEDGSIVLSKENGLALLVAPEYTEVMTSWSQEFTKVFNKLQDQGFNPSQWFVPTVEQLKLAYKTIPDEFSTTYYWSSTENIATFGCGVNFFDGLPYGNWKEIAFCVRAFRCVTY